MTIIGVLVIENRTNTCWCEMRGKIKEFLANLVISSATVIRSSSADGLNQQLHHLSYKDIGAAFT